MSKVTSAELIRYNANTRGTRTGDCTARAISLAFGIDYQKARKALNDSAKEHNLANKRPFWEYNSHANCLKVIRELGGGEINGNVERESVDSFANNHPTGTYIIWCSKNGLTHTGNHLVTIIDGKIYDSWDSRVYMVKGVWTIANGTSGADIVDLKPYLDEFFSSVTEEDYHKVFDNIVDKNRKLKKLCNEYDTDITITLDISKASRENYTFKFIYKIDISFSNSNIKETKFDGKFAIAFKPTMQAEQVKDYFTTTFYDKLYSSIHTAVDKVEDMLEGDKLLGNAQRSENGISFWNDSDRRSFNSLPYWVRQLATQFYINPGDYSDRIRLRMYRLPNDPEYNPEGNDDNVIHIGRSPTQVSFYAPTMDNLRMGLEVYKKTGDFDRAYDVAMDY